MNRVTCAICGHTYHICEVLTISGIHICGMCTSTYHVPAVCNICGLPLTYTKHKNSVIRACTICNNTACIVAKCAVVKHVAQKRTYYGRQYR